MKIKRIFIFDQRIITCIITLSLALLSFLTYYDILGFYFTGTDTLTLIDTARINSFDDLLRIFSEPMMNGTGFIDIAGFYRPISVLSHSLDYSIWGLNPYGHHLTGLILHSLVSIAVYFTIKVLTDGKHFTASIAAIIFATHPAFIENVPSIENRQDIIAALFLLVSLLAFLKYFFSLFQSHGYLFLSLVFYAIALGSREISVILSGLVFIYLMINSTPDNESFKNRFVISVKGSLPYFLLTILYLAWRTYVLKGMGGYASEPVGLSSAVLQIFQIVIIYFKLLLYPVDFLSIDSIFSPFTTVGKQVLFSLVVVLFFIVLFVYRRPFFKVKDDTKGILGALRVLILVFLILSTIFIVAYPIVSPYINQIIQTAYNGEGYEFISGLMGQKDALAVDSYFYKVRDILLNLSFISIVLSICCLAVIYQCSSLMKYGLKSINGKVMILLSVWLFLPLLIYVLTLSFPYWGMYLSVIPLSAILSILLVKGVKSVIKRIQGYDSSDHSCWSLLISPSIVTSFLVALLLISFLVHSPLFRTYRGWKESADVSAMILTELSGIVDEIPDDSVIEILDLPKDVPSYKSDMLHSVHIVYLLHNHSIKSWLDLNYPDNDLKVLIRSRLKPEVYVEGLDLEIVTRENKNIRVAFKCTGAGK